MTHTSDSNLLFGILALQMDLITREQLITGMQSWVNDKATPLEEHLVRTGALNHEDRALLEPLVAKHVTKHNNDPQQSLAALSSVAPIKDALKSLQDPELDATLQHFNCHQKSSGQEQYAIETVGSSTSLGTRFRILRPHAEGGLGSIFVARDTELDRDVALKEIQLDKADDIENRVRFTREAAITGWLEHPGIVPIYGLGTYPDGRPFYAMKFIDGNSLKEAIERFHLQGDNSLQDPIRNLQLRRLLQRFIDVCEAIDFAHSRGVLHRDLKPGNIMLGRNGETLVVDWGMAKKLDESRVEDPTSGLARFAITSPPSGCSLPGTPE